MSKPAGRSQEYLLVALLAFSLAAISLSYCYSHHLLLLYGDAVAHLHIARRILDSRQPGFRQLGTVWLPLPHLVLFPFVQRMDWWRSGLAGAWPSMAFYVAACTGIYRLARFWMRPVIALVAFALFAMNPSLLYLATTAMTEPLFLAALIWTVVFTVSYRRHVEKGEWREARYAIAGATMALLAAIYTRYDGWVLAALTWLFFVPPVLSQPGKPLRAAAAGMTAALAAAPLLWLGYNRYLAGDALDFLRGPYSARAIDARTSHPGAPHYPGFHSMPVAALHFFKAAKLDAGSGRGGEWIALLAIGGLAFAAWKFRKQNVAPLSLLLLPIFFYAYSIAYGSVPIFVPVWWPFSWYNTRYGLELLPALALFPAFLLSVLGETGWRRFGTGLAALLVLVNSVRTMRATPTVLQEARANSATRIPFEHALARTLIYMPSNATLLMYTSAFIGALQEAGLPLRQTINEGSYLEWQQALREPAARADYVLAFDGDDVARAVAAHPQGLNLLSVICSTGQPCARLYGSTARPGGSDVYTPR